MAVNKPVGRQRAQGCGEKAQPGKDEIGRCRRLDQAQHLVRKIHGGQEAGRKENVGEEVQGRSG
jgi:hypothetical protein